MYSLHWQNTSILISILQPTRLQSKIIIYLMTPIYIKQNMTKFVWTFKEQNFTTCISSRQLRIKRKCCQFMSSLLCLSYCVFQSCMGHHCTCTPVQTSSEQKDSNNLVETHVIQPINLQFYNLLYTTLHPRPYPKAEQFAEIAYIMAVHRLTDFLYETLP